MSEVISDWWGKTVQEMDNLLPGKKNKVELDP